MITDPKKKLNRILEHAMGVVVAAALAGIFTFFQQLASGAGLCPDPATSAEQAGFLGGMLKGGHSYWKVKKGTFFL